MTRREVQLSAAEADVLAELVWDGASNAEIADRLGLSEGTVKVHMKAILRAFDRGGRAAVVAVYLRRGVVLSVAADRRRAS